MSDNVIEFKKPKFIPLQAISDATEIFMRAVRLDDFTSAIFQMPDGRYSVALEKDGKYCEIVISVIGD